MTDKERLESVKNAYKHDKLIYSDLNWLIEQAEKVQELEKKLHKAKCKIGNKDKHIKTLNGKVAGAYNHLNRVQNDRNAKHNVLEKWRPQMKSMREALEQISNSDVWFENEDLTDYDGWLRCTKISDQALEELK